MIKKQILSVEKSDNKDLIKVNKDDIIESFIIFINLNNKNEYK